MKINRLNGKKIVLSVLLAGTMLSSAGTISKAWTFHNFDFFMNGRGCADRSNDQKKEVGGEAFVNIKSISTSAAPALEMTMRVRAKSHDRPATNPFPFSKNKRGAVYLAYNSPYGKMGGMYYLKMQTNSKASQCAWVDGNWRA